MIVEYIGDVQLSADDMAVEDGMVEFVSNTVFDAVHRVMPEAVAMYMTPPGRLRPDMAVVMDDGSTVYLACHMTIDEILLINQLLFTHDVGLLGK